GPPARCHRRRTPPCATSCPSALAPPPARPARSCPRAKSCPRPATAAGRLGSTPSVRRARVALSPATPPCETSSPSSPAADRAADPPPPPETPPHRIAPLAQ